jgi:hypothetical protein
MRARLSILAIAVASLVAVPASAQASFGFLPGTEGFDASVTNPDGSPGLKAGTHPYAMKVGLRLKMAGQLSDGDLRDLHLSLPSGLLLNPNAVDRCLPADFHTPRSSPFEASLSGESCPDRSQVGVVAIHSSYGGGSTRHFGVFNLAPPYGAPGALAFSPFGVPIVLIPHIREGDASIVLDLERLPQNLNVSGIDLTLWGTPWRNEHDGERGNCLNEVDPAAYHGELSTPPGPNEVPPYKPGTCSLPFSLAALLALTKSYLTLPPSCQGPLHWGVSATSWQQPGVVEAGVLSHDAGGDPVGLEECKTTLSTAQAQLTTASAASPSGLLFDLDLNDGGGTLNPGGTARPPIQKAVVTLPEGLTINPSVGAGLGACSVADFARETVDSAPGEGCPNPSKVGEVVVEGMLGFAEPVQGSLFVAKPYENPFGTLLSLYMVAKSPQRGLLVKAMGKVEPDPRTGRLLASFENLPQLLYTRFSLRFRQGQRAVMISPPACGAYQTQLELTPWSEPDARVHNTSILGISSGEGGGSCPGGSARPFQPQLLSGSLNPNGGSYSPFSLRMTRTDADQEITSYSAKLPPGLLGKIAGIPYCPDAALEVAKTRSGIEEAERPSCPAASEIGHTVSGYGVGPVLAYAPGKLFLAGPYHGAPLSIAAVDSALVGPFDLGTVIVRSAIKVDPRTAQVSVDSAGSDPIPHILKGIPLHLRDIRVYVDRPDFALNPTSCDPLSTTSTLTGVGADAFSSSDDVSATAVGGFQLLNCSALGFKPKLAFRLKGGTKRGDYPSLRATLTPRPGDANIAKAAVTLPSSVFLAQEHIDTICTMAQSSRNACPAGSVYGRARAITPLLGEVLEGPVYLRASTNPLPDLVTALRSPSGIAIDVVGRIDSVRGGIRARFDVLPDAPVTRFTMALNGGKRGLLVNEQDMCSTPQLAAVRMVGQNNATAAFKPRLRAKCPKHSKRRHGKGGAGR